MVTDLSVQTTHVETPGGDELIDQSIRLNPE